ncbi:bifunctional 2-C-methyl-D-erythritol 4-phosphate cytidylyltransferase/2-C-methyl-D-erythritol 2,4-cyclodiphosphate synthase [Novosphingobium olei]|uniref:Bifunctional enzyme IspD/IspF n=1 Tax=Novosphingobium olei TaxID=2728851 RepID=A0A7Y0GAE9_9SPHN|nr:bifunctional 2-C-methyl-D-erythritol 4-phosphate cytidylyltransferase/2-C-methyl-D-erythritol 2,4-cyclodiphosphate synthase [Novosphingobium olei]NML94028.1 bifunctional 2-C-methyl-D-erythritol 4-phosphate cytidylyltransferase/2-C-methyl-D-erythritol 2,4-cyclodiphosphate synthase [Novosphingobium olei]
MTAPLPPSTSAGVAAIIVAAGKGLRAGGEVPKQFARWRGAPLLRHSAQAMAAAGVAPIVVAIPAGWDDVAAQALSGLDQIVLVHGGETRQESVRLALEALEEHRPANVLIHDAARPDLPARVIRDLVTALAAKPGAIPVLPVVDSVVRGDEGVRVKSVSRDGLYRVQTPQAFRFADILAAHRAWQGVADAGDDAEVGQAAGLAIGLVQGDERLRKVTFATDLEEISLPERYPRTGLGLDVHRLAEGEELWLCGIRVPHDKGLAGHSDADVAIHALVDAILGAIGAGDIGDHFPPSDPQWKGASSDRFLAHAVALARKAGYRPGNVDVTIICEAPKIGPHKPAMRARLAEVMGADIDQVSVKATTTERLGLTGRGEGIAAQAVAVMVPLQEEFPG